MQIGYNFQNHKSHSTTNDYLNLYQCSSSETLMHSNKIRYWKLHVRAENISKTPELTSRFFVLCATFETQEHHHHASIHLLVLFIISPFVLSSFFIFLFLLLSSDNSAIWRRKLQHH